MGSEANQRHHQSESLLLQPKIAHGQNGALERAGSPEREEELAILKENLPFADAQILEYVTDFLQQAHAAEERFSIRDGINIIRYTMKLQANGDSPVHDRISLPLAVKTILGVEAMRYVRSH